MSARKDLQYWTRRGVLVQRGPDNGRLYTLAPLTTWKDGRP